jgi:hypothetical protein
MKSTIQIPAILTANTYFWKPAASATARRRSEEQKKAMVATFFQAIGMDVKTLEDRVIAEKEDLMVIFHYSESCKNIYKSLTVKRGDKNSNITAIRKIVDKINAAGAVPAK